MADFDCAIVGAGIHGLCTAFALRQRGGLRLIVLEQHEPGHERGSSHGSTRITRSSYDDPAFVAMAQRANTVGWPQLERALGSTLRVPTPGVFFGPADGPIAAYRAATAAAGAPVETLGLAAARARFPLLRFHDDDAVLLDHSAAMVLAADTMQALRRWLAANDVVFSWRCAVRALQEMPGAVQLTTDEGPIAARHVVLACGPWSRRLHHADVPTPTVLRQEVGFADLDAPLELQEAGTFPVWARIGHGADDFSYGLPSWRKSGLKFAWHRTTGTGIDPDAAPPAIDEAPLLALARARFARTVHGLARTERCLYTMAAGHGLHVIHRTGTPVTTIAACSGHAFKFAPLLGERAATTVTIDR